MNPYYNLPLEQRRVQRLVAQFNADERLWRSLARNRRQRRKLFPFMPVKLQKQLDLLEFTVTRPPEDCIGLR